MEWFMPNDRSARWFKFIGYRFYCLPEVSDEQTFLEAATELPLPRDFWWLRWVHSQGGGFNHGLQQTGGLQ